MSRALVAVRRNPGGLLGGALDMVKRAAIPSAVSALEDLYLVRPLSAKFGVPKTLQPVAEILFGIAQAVAVQKFAPKHAGIAAASMQCLTAFAARDAIARAMNHPFAQLSDLADQYAGVVETTNGVRGLNGVSHGVAGVIEEMAGPDDVEVMGEVDEVESTSDF